MSIPPVLPSGKYPEILVNNAPFSKTLGTAPVEQGEPAGKAKFSTAADIERMEKETTTTLREGKIPVKDIVLLSKEQGGLTTGGTSESKRTEGKTVINNKVQGFTVRSIFTDSGQIIIRPESENQRAELGVPTHGFFYHDLDFLTKAAKEYATLGENEVFKHRNIDDLNFVHDTLDFFTNGNYSAEDVQAVQQQMTDIVKELAQQIKNGESPDLSKVESTLTIGGTDITISQLKDFKEIGGDLRESFDNISTGSTVHTQRYSQMGIAKAMANHYGSDKGQIGEMFSSAMDRLYEKGVAQIEKHSAASSGYFNSNPYSHILTLRDKDAVATGLKIADTFSTLDASSKESLSKDFASKLSEIQSLVKNHCQKYGGSAVSVGLAGDVADITKYFNSWMDRI